MSPDIIAALYERALAAEIGCAVEIQEADRKTHLVNFSKAKAKYKDPRWDTITLINPTREPAEIWLVKKTTELDP